MNDLQRHSCLLVLQLHPLSFRKRFADEMFLYYEDLLQSHYAFRLTLDLFRSPVRQWGAVLSAEVWPESAASRPTFLTGHCALGFQLPLTPYELARGFMLSVLLFSTFWYTEDPLRGHPGDLLRMISSTAAPRSVFASATPPARS